MERGGDVDAGGRLPVTLLRSAGQVGLTSAHHHVGGKSMFLTTYVDAPNTPLFPLGHGLSYTTWEYERVEVAMGTAADDVIVEVDLHNSGTRDGEEVVQVYVRDETASVGVVAKRLMAFQRVAVAAGQRVQLRFTIPGGRFGFHGADVRYRVEPGDFTFLVGGHELLRTMTGELAHPDLNSLPPFRCQITGDQP